MQYLAEERILDKKLLLEVAVSGSSSSIRLIILVNFSFLFTFYKNFWFYFRVIIYPARSSLKISLLIIAACLLPILVSIKHDIIQYIDHYISIGIFDNFPIGFIIIIYTNRIKNIFKFFIKNWRKCDYGSIFPIFSSSFFLRNKGWDGSLLIETASLFQ